MSLSVGYLLTFKSVFQLGLFFIRVGFLGCFLGLERSFALFCAFQGCFALFKDVFWVLKGCFEFLGHPGAVNSARAA